MVATHSSPQSPSIANPDRSPCPGSIGGREESYTHYLARESQVFLEVLIVCSLVATVLLMITFFFFAFIPVIVLLLSYGLLVLANAIERHTATGAPFGAAEEAADVRRAGSDPTQAGTVRMTFGKGWGIRSEDALRRRLARVTIEILAGAGLLALVMASIVLPLELVILGVGVLFAYIVFITAPVWLAWLNDETSDEERRQAKQA